MPLNIDAQQILLHLLNFVILAGGLYLLLYKPTKAFMEKRLAYYQQLSKEANETLEGAQLEKEKWKETMDAIDKEIEKKRDQARKDLSLQLDQEKKAAEKEKSQLLEQARKEAQQERAKTIQETRAAMADLAVEAVEKVWKSASKQSLERFLKEEQAHEE